MNKRELIEKVAEINGWKKVDAERAVNAVVKAISDSLLDYNKVHLIGFGTFEVRQRKAREGRDPRTNEPIQIDACNTVTFRTGKTLKDALNFREE